MPIMHNKLIKNQALFVSPAGPDNKVEDEIKGSS
jgi:hypothetical protein